MDIITIVGLVFGAVCVVVSILLDGELSSFWNIPSIFITVGGGIASVLISCKKDEPGKIIKVAAKAFTCEKQKGETTITLLVELSQKARREGLLALETELEDIKDSFIRRYLQLIIDGVEPEAIRESMSLELESMEFRHARGQGMFKTMGALFPAWGMIGTLIGLINLLKQLSDPSKIGPSMAVAMITTFYGSILANFVCIPIANKLAVKSKEEIHLKEMVVEGILSIQAGENTKLMENKLMTFLSPDQRKNYEEYHDTAALYSVPQ
jgi:chemotaxis protein MotA